MLESDYAQRHVEQDAVARCAVFECLRESEHEARWGPGESASVNASESGVRIPAEYKSDSKQTAIVFLRGIHRRSLSMAVVVEIQLLQYHHDARN